MKIQFRQCNSITFPMRVSCTSVCANTGFVLALEVAEIAPTNNLHILFAPKFLQSTPKPKRSRTTTYYTGRMKLHSHESPDLSIKTSKVMLLTPSPVSQMVNKVLHGHPIWKPPSIVTTSDYTDTQSSSINNGFLQTSIINFPIE